MARSADSPYVRAYLRGLTRVSVLGLVLGIVFAGLGLFLLGSTVVDSTRTYEPVQVTATDERTQQQASGARKTKKMIDVRIVTVTLPDGTSDEVRSDDIAVGDTATVYVDPSTDRLYEEVPEGSFFEDWAIPLVCVLLGAIGLAVGISKARTRARLSRVDLQAPATIRLQVTGVRQDVVGRKPVHKITATVLGSSDAQHHQGDVLEVTVGAKKESPDQLAAVLDGRFVSGNEFGGAAALHAAETAEPWWIGAVVNTTANKRLLAQATS